MWYLYSRYEDKEYIHEECVDIYQKKEDAFKRLLALYKYDDLTGKLGDYFYFVVERRQ